MGNTAKRVSAFRDGMEIIHLARLLQGEESSISLLVTRTRCAGATNLVEVYRARGRKLRKLDTKLWHPMPR